MTPTIDSLPTVLVRPGDTTALRVALGRLLDDPASAAELGRRARQRCAERYSFATARAVLFPLIDDLASKFRLKRGT